MNGLRLYCPPVTTGSPGDKGIFYSRRGAGPYYRWGYNEKLRSWCPVRLLSSDLIALAMDLARWKSIPDALRTRLEEHYLE